MALKGFFTAGPYDDGDPVTGHYYEVASNDPSRAQVWGYTGGLSYAPGERLTLHAMSSAAQARLVIARDPDLQTERGTAFDAAAASGGSAAVEAVAAVADSGQSAWVRSEIAQNDRPELTAAKIIVSGGRALGSADQLPHVFVEF